jgi:alpha-L-glutamate ligase-like protein
MNARNLYVERENTLPAIRLVNNKYLTKEALRAAKVPVTPTIALVSDRRDLATIDWDALPDAWVVKPNRGRQGAGVLLVDGRDGSGWRSASGHQLTQAEVEQQIRDILEREASSAVDRDEAIMEPLIVMHEGLRKVVPLGLPDIRVICYHDEPVMAMLRLPTRASKGRANLHQGGMGAGLELRTGKVFRAMMHGQPVTRHPDTDAPLAGLEVPGWETVLEAASRSGSATGLAYAGADIVVERDRGTLVLQVNALPGLEIQNVNGMGLAAPLGSAGKEMMYRH